MRGVFGEILLVVSTVEARLSRALSGDCGPMYCKKSEMWEFCMTLY